MIKSTKRAEVISSTFDEGAARHVLVADMVLEKAKRLVEAGQGRRDSARLSHAIRARAQRSRSQSRKDSFRRCRCSGTLQAEEILRQRAQDRWRRITHDHRDSADRNRLANGRRDLRGVQGHRQHGARARPEDCRPQGLSRDRHPEIRNAKGGAASFAGRDQSRDAASPVPRRHARSRSSGISPEADEENRRTTPSSSSRWRRAERERITRQVHGCGLRREARRSRDQ